MWQKILNRLLTAETRVAPVKSVSLSRLEVRGVVLLTEIVTAILPPVQISAARQISPMFLTGYESLLTTGPRLWPTELPRSRGDTSQLLGTRSI